jgi:uncharacterized Zn-binding protein involved in type VI secretion
MGDHWVEHCCVVCHDGTMQEGSSKVFINGMAAARIGDAISCGSVAAKGSETVFFG